MKNCPALYLILCLCLAIFVSCGVREEVSTQVSQYTVIQKEEERILEPVGKDDMTWHLLGRQFVQGDAVQIWGVNTGSLMDVYLYWEDGSGELLQEGVPMEYYANWYLDSEGGGYIFGKNLLIRFDKEGNELYCREGNDIMDLCQMQDGRVMVLVQDGSRFVLEELDPSTGGLSRKDRADLGQGSLCYISAGQGGLLLMDRDGIWELGLEDGSRKSILPFRGTYDPGATASDFLVQEDGMALVLQKGGILQTLQLYDPTEGREVIVIRSVDFAAQKDMANYIEMFNRQSTKYFVVTDEMEEIVIINNSLDLSWFQDETVIQIAAGKGADIICADAIYNAWDLIENGVFEDLAPYMERDGIRQEDYFPAAFGCWRNDDSIYGVTTYTSLSDVWIDAELLEGNESGEIGKLVDALLAYEGDAVFIKNMWIESLLGYFLNGSESLWGMVDWEKGTCDFSGELFAGILEVSKRYAYDKTKEDTPALAGRLRSNECSFYGYDYYAEQEKTQGRVHIGFLADGGNSASTNYDNLLAISSASAHKEGAWEFIRFLLSEEAQMEEKVDYNVYPVNKACYDKYGARVIAQGSIVQQNDTTTIRGQSQTVGEDNLVKILGSDGYKEIFDPTEERVARIKAVLEAAETSSSVRADKIRAIIAEEAGTYFAGDKSIEEVAAIIQNRVQLYLDEHQK